MAFLPLALGARGEQSTQRFFERNVKTVGDQQDLISRGEEARISAARTEFHAGLLQSGTLQLTESQKGGPGASNADSTNRFSSQVARHIALALQAEVVAERAAGQTLGGNFETAVTAFLRETFPYLQSVRPGRWTLEKVGNLGSEKSLSRFDQYSHLDQLDKVSRNDRVLKAALGNAYAISPDVVISRAPEPDAMINQDHWLVDDHSALLSPLRERPDGRHILHAVISCKWTMRSDRSQNSRSEALNLIRNRKGRVPHIAVVTAEPMPSRISSLALGTGDIDCVYHFALPELQAAIEEYGDPSSQDLIAIMVEGNRLKDLSDLPLDLAV